MTADSPLIKTLGQLKLDKYVLTETKQLDHVKLSRFAQTLLLILIVWLLSQLTWQLLTPVKTPAVVTQSSSGLSANNSSPRIDIKAMTKLNLFGDYHQVVETVEEVEVAPITSLNLKLMGVVSSSDDDLAAAIIEKSGSQNTYGIGEKIDGTQAVIREIFSDRIILEQNKNRETLMLEGVDYIAQSNNQAIKKPIDKSSIKKDRKKLSKKDAALLEKQRAEFLTDPGKVSDYIKAAPFNRGGRLVGYKIRPGKKAELFRAFGLRSGDIAIEINGYDLTDLSQAMLAMQELRSATEASLLVERNGEIVETHFSLN
ncbi:type II secretion system protein GspC [Algibacillus agarilyticus]|uniref:type II secretion system protein GspC n=1 Tax=Algibacillus agarilyticus TaxID=2234133 RepID=UPI000DD0AE87|nr:type II secretion system protein GspC [Algibacillus agarilyticus]